MKRIERWARPRWLRTLIAAGVLALGASIAPVASAADTIFWTTPIEANQIYYANLDGTSSAPSTLNTAGATVEAPWGIAPDPADGKVYWANFRPGGDGKTISWANLDGSGGGDLNTSGATVLGPNGVVVDHAAGKIYWANWTANKISWARLDGSGGGDLNTGTATVDHPQGVAIDEAVGKIYWANYVGDRISFAKLDGSGGGDLNIIGTTVSRPWGVTIDSALNKIYWGNFGTDDLDFANLDGTGGGVLSTTGATQHEPMPGAVDPAAGKIYWADYTGGTVSVANADGSGAGRTLYPTAPGARPAMPALLDVPAGLSAPSIIGGAGAPSSLSCSPGTWGGDLIGSALYRAPQSLSYSWSRNGAAIPGASGSSIAAGQAGSYQCQVAARNFAGAAVTASAPHTVAPPATASAIGSTSGVTATVHITCHGVSGQVCTGLAALDATIVEPRRAHSESVRHKTAGHKTATVGSGGYVAAAGQTTTISIRLNHLGRGLLERADVLKTTLHLGTAAQSRTVTFRFPRIQIDPKRLAWRVTVGEFTFASELIIAPLPVGAAVKISCRGPGCPFAHHTSRAKRRQLTVTRLFGDAKLRPGSKVTFTITARYHVGEVVVYDMRARGAAKPITISCLQPGSRHPVKC